MIRMNINEGNTIYLFQCPVNEAYVTTCHITSQRQAYVTRKIHYLVVYFLFHCCCLQNSKIKFPLPHRIIKSHYKSKFVAKRPNTHY